MGNSGSHSNDIKATENNVGAAEAAATSGGEYGAVATEDDHLLADLGNHKVHASRESRRFDPLSVRLMDVVRVYWHLGLIAFGGPSAHVAILRDHLVEHHQWIDEDAFMELFALGQGLPGPSSTQLVISTAVTHAGPLGGMIAFVFWTLPAFLVLTTSGLFLSSFIDPKNPPIWLLGVPPAAVSLIFKAFYGFGRTLDKVGLALAMLACAVAVMINGDENIAPTSSQIVYPALLVLGGLTTYLDFCQENPIGIYVKPETDVEQSAADRRLGYKIGIPLYAGGLVFLLWLALLVGSVTLVNLGYKNEYLEIFEIFYRIGSIIFGGGVVVLPMLQNELVPRGWVTNEQFFQGLGLAQSMPGPLFNFASFLGATYKGVLGAIVAELALFGPGYILIFAMVPFWSRIRHWAWFKAVLKGVNASAIGLIGSGCVFLYAAAVKTAADAMVFVLAGGLASFYSAPAPGCIFVGALLGAAFSPAILNVGQKEYH